MAPSCLTEVRLLVFLFLLFQTRLLSRQLRGELLSTLLLSRFILTLQRICKVTVEGTVPDLFALMYPHRFVLKVGDSGVFSTDCRQPNYDDEQNRWRYIK